jgi:cytochrome P450
MSTQVDLFSLETHLNPYPVYALLREKNPVHQVMPHGYWAVSRYEDVAFLLKTHQVFSSNTGFDEMKPPHISEALWRELTTLRAKFIIDVDPPEHTRLRKVVAGAFTPKAITRLEERVREITTQHLDEMLEKEQIDLVADFAIPLPITVIATMLGIDPGMRADFKRWSDDILEMGQIMRVPMPPERVEEVIQSRRQFLSYFRELIEARRHRLGEDLISDLLRAETEVGALSADEVLSMVIILLVAGNETTTNLIATGMHLLLDHPDALAALRADPSLMPNFLEEVLRFEAPVPMLFRRTKTEVTLSGVTIPGDQVVLAMLSSANRDAAQFPEPDRFDIRRDTRGHVAFGYGVHFCVGAPLSRLEGRVAFEELLRRLPAFSRENAEADWNHRTSMRALASLKLRLDRPAARVA